MFTFHHTRKEREKKERKRLATREKLSIQWNPNNRRYLINYPLSNTDLYQLITALDIKNFRGVFSRDALSNRKHKNECGIVNLDDIMGPGTHWTAYCITKKENEYFDSFGKLPKPKKGFTLPGYNYAGPYNPLEKQVKFDPEAGEILDVYQKPSGKTDAVAMQHDVDYTLCGDNKNCKNKADAKMVKALDSIPWKERQWGHAGVRNVIAAKQKLGLGMKKK